MDLLAVIRWDVDPTILSYGFITLRWYGLLFALAFLVDYQIMLRIFKYEHKTQRDLESLTIAMVIATIVGARLGHCLFYDFSFYITHPLKILYVWEGGLASHGGAIGILIALYLYSKKRPDQPFLWIADRIAIVAALSGFFIRLGNLFNSEIFGMPTSLPWGFIFVRAQDAGLAPRHPTQLYEALFYIIVFFVLYSRYKVRREKTPHGSLLGWFLILVFSFRFLVEFLKVNQESFENTLPLNMGQLLSIPFVLTGVWLLLRSRNNQPAVDKTGRESITTR
jgi:phosphatidylglycerol:prolipoprotein diacylglycerol transferase